MDKRTLPGDRYHSCLVRFLVLAASVLGVLLVLVATSRYGAGTSPDSVAYVSTARNLVSGRGYVTYDGNPLVLFPPLFPTLLAGIGLGGIDPLDAARYVNAVSFGLIIVASSLWLLKHTKSTVVAVLGTVAVLFSISLVRVSVYAWSEPVFILLTLLCLLALEEFLGNDKPSVLVFAATFAALATLQRYIGVTVILTGLILLILHRETAWSRRFENAAIFSLVAFLPVGAWVVRNALVSSTLIGQRWPSPYTPIQHLYNALDTVTGWFLPSSSSFDAARWSSLPQSLRTLVQSVMLPPFPRLVVGVSLLTAIIGVLMLIGRHSPHHGRRACLPLAIPMLCFLIVYPAFLIVTSSLYWHQEPINNRYMSPIYVSLIALVALFVDASADFVGKRSRSRAPAWLLLVVFGVWLVYPLSLGIGKVIYSARDGAGGYSSPLWRNSGLISYLNQHRLSGQVYTNAPYALYIDAGMSVRLSPRKYDYQTHDANTEDLVRFRASLAARDDTYLAWFENEDSSHLYNPHELGSMFEMNVVATAEDGALYRVEP